jgi:hypothetical protein
LVLQASGIPSPTAPYQGVTLSAQDTQGTQATGHSGYPHEGMLSNWTPKVSAQNTPKQLDTPTIRTRGAKSTKQLDKANSKQGPIGSADHILKQFQLG